MTGADEQPAEPEVSIVDAVAPVLDRGSVLAGRLAAILLTVLPT